MFKLFSLVIISTAFLSASKVQAASVKQDPYLVIQSMSVEEQAVDQNVLQSIRTQIHFQELQQSRHVFDGGGNPLDPVDEANHIVDGIINIGKKIWAIFEASTPVVNLDVQRANALPKDIKDWTDMEGWSDVEAKQYSVSYKNAFNSEVVRFQVLMTYSYNGTFKGAGKYLNQVGFLVNNYYVAPLYRLDAHSEVVRIQNVGTKADPIAAMELNLVYNVSNVLNKSQSALNYYVRGDGAIKVRLAQ